MKEPISEQVDIEEAPPELELILWLGRKRGTNNFHQWFFKKYRREYKLYCQTMLEANMQNEKIVMSMFLEKKLKIKKIRKKLQRYVEKEWVKISKRYSKEIKRIVKLLIKDDALMQMVSDQINKKYHENRKKMA